MVPRAHRGHLGARAGDARRDASRVRRIAQDPRIAEDRGNAQDPRIAENAQVLGSRRVLGLVLRILQRSALMRQCTMSVRGRVRESPAAQDPRILGLLRILGITENPRIAEDP